MSNKYLLNAHPNDHIFDYYNMLLHHNYHNNIIKNYKMYYYLMK